MRLYDYRRSSAAYRVRIALLVKGIGYDQVPVNLRQGTHRTLDYIGQNPQGMVPTLADGELRLTQSLAIIEYLEETCPQPRLLPADPAGRAEVRSLALQIACDMHPLGSLRVLQHLQHRLGLEEREASAWCRHWNDEGLTALEARLKRTGGKYSYGDTVTLADVCLVPQLYQARRYNCDLTPFATIRRVEAACLELPAFQDARPERQPE